MKINYVEIKNYKSFGDYTTRFDFDFIGTLLLTGTNGSGKTTLIDAIIWSLYGKSLDTAEGVVNREIGKDCKVEVNFDINENNYSIIRFRAHSVHQNNVLIFKNKDNVSPRTIRDAQSMINDIIQISYNAITSSIIFSSELYVSFLRSEPSERLKILESVLSLKEIEQYQKEVNNLRQPITELIAQLNVDGNKFIVEKDTLTKNLVEFFI